MGVAPKDIEPYHVAAGIPAKTVKVKTIAPPELQPAERKSGT
jgi:acetyltransferase-like isoleucine patch superfamily enzyme